MLTALIGVVPSLARLTPGALSSVAAEVAIGHDAPELPTTVIANLILVALAAGAAWLAFRRQEL